MTSAGVPLEAFIAMHSQHSALRDAGILLPKMRIAHRMARR